VRSSADRPFKGDEETFDPARPHAALDFAPSRAGRRTSCRRSCPRGAQPPCTGSGSPCDDHSCRVPVRSKGAEFSGCVGAGQLGTHARGCEGPRAADRLQSSGRFTRPQNGQTSLNGNGELILARVGLPWAGSSPVRSSRGSRRSPDPSGTIHRPTAPTRHRGVCTAPEAARHP
jgi:hypothetical protein